MKLSTRLAAGALVASLAAVPATAEAKPVSAGKVRAQVKAADKSLDRLLARVRSNRDSAAAKELRKFRRQLRRAEAQVKRLRRSTKSVGGARSYGSGVRMVGSTANACADSLASIVDEAAAAPQEAIANGVSSCILARERVVEALAQRMNRTPGKARRYLARVVTTLSSDGEDEVAAITDALRHPALPARVAAILTRARDLGSRAVEDAVTRLEKLLGVVPGDVRPMGQRALAVVTRQLEAVKSMEQDSARRKNPTRPPTSPVARQPAPDPDPVPNPAPPVPDPTPPVPDPTPPVSDPSVCSIAPANGNAAIAAAIESCPNGSTVRFPANGSYTQTGSIVVDGRSNLTIDGNGSTFRSTAPNDLVTSTPNWRIDSGSNVVLQRMTIVGNFTAAGRGIKPGNQLNHGVLVRGGDGVTVRDATIRNVWGDGVTTARSGWIPGNSVAGVAPRNTRLQRLTITSVARMCVAFTEQVGGWLEDSALSDCHYAGVDLETDVGGQVLRDVHILRNKISGYYIMGIGVAGPVLGMGTPAAGDLDRIEVRGNTVGEGDTCWSPILFSDPLVSRGPISNISVADNAVTAQGDGISINDVVGGSVTGNRITTTRGRLWCGTLSALVLPVKVLRSTGVTVSGSTVVGY